MKHYYNVYATVFGQMGATFSADFNHLPTSQEIVAAIEERMEHFCGQSDQDELDQDVSIEGYRHLIELVTFAKVPEVQPPPNRFEDSKPATSRCTVAGHDLGRITVTAKPIWRVTRGLL